jgi:hypothetical protein
MQHRNSLTPEKCNTSKFGRDVKDLNEIQATHSDQLVHMIVLDRTMFATEMKNKVYVQGLDTLTVYGQGDLVPLVFADEEAC